jgi:hypothetical protein
LAEAVEQALTSRVRRRRSSSSTMRATSKSCRCSLPSQGSCWLPVFEGDERTRHDRFAKSLCEKFILRAGSIGYGPSRPSSKIFRFSRNTNHPYPPLIPPPHEGRIAIVTDVGSGMRWTLGMLKRACAPTIAFRRTAKSCGPDSPTLESSLAVRPARRRRLESPARRGERV